MKERKRINISLDPATYEQLRKIQKRHGFKNMCELVVAFVNILIDRVEDADHRRYDIPDGDGEYIDNMFEDLGHVIRTPDGTVPVTHKSKKLI